LQLFNNVPVIILSTLESVTNILEYMLSNIQKFWVQLG